MHSRLLFQLLDHQDQVVGDCDAVQGPCPFAQIGCSRTQVQLQVFLSFIIFRIVSFTHEEYKSTEIVDCLYPSLFSNVDPLNARNKINTWVNPEQRQYNTKKYLLGFLNQTSTSPSSKQLEFIRLVPPLLPPVSCNVAFRA